MPASKMKWCDVSDGGGVVSCIQPRADGGPIAISQQAGSQDFIAVLCLGEPQPMQSLNAEECSSLWGL
jgi:hypothetical protein